MHVGWDKLCKPREEGGLGIRRVPALCKATGRNKVALELHHFRFFLGKVDENSICVKSGKF